MVHDVLLVPLDPAGGGAEVASTAIDLATRLGARVVLLYVIHLPGKVEPKALEQLRRDAHAQLGSIEAPFRARGVPVRIRVEIGGAAPAPAILEAASAEHATMIVMGTHGRTGVARLILGSVTEQVVRTSTIPVLTIRTGQETEPRE